MKRCIAIASLAFLAGCAGMRPPQSFPDVGREASHDAVIVAMTQRGSYLPQFPECEAPNVICMDPPPFWFRARVVDVVFGPVEQTSIAVATTSHYGMELFGLNGEPSLLRLAIDGSAVVMPRYAEVALHADRRGELFVVLDGPDPIWWLPCSVMDVVADIDAGQFADDLLISAEYFSQDEIARREDFLARADTGFLPKRGLPVSSLKRHLRSRYAGQKLPECHQSR